VANLILPRRFQQPIGDAVVDQAFSKRCTFALNAGSGARDLISRALPGAAGSGVSWTAGNAGRALKFDGTQANGAFSWGTSFNPFAGSKGLTVVAVINYDTSASRRVLAKWGASPNTFVCGIGSGSLGEPTLGIGDTAGGSEAYRSSGLHIPANKDTVVVFRWNGANGAAGYSFFVDGVKAPSVVSVYDTTDPTAVPANTTGNFQLGVSDDGAPALGNVYAAFGFNGALTDAECFALSRNPWQIFKPARRVLYFDAGGGGGQALEGSALASAAASGTLTTEIPISGAAAVVTTSSGGLTTAIPLSGSASSVSVVDGNLTTTITLTGSAIAQAFAQAGLDSAILLSGAASTSASASASLTTQMSLSGEAIAAALAAADLATTPSGLSGQASAAASASGALLTQIPLVGDAQAYSIASGGLTTLIPLSGAAASVSSASGDLTIEATMRGEAIAAAVAGGTLSTQIILSGAALSNAAALGSLGGGTVLPAVLPHLVEAIISDWTVQADNGPWEIAA
jgi:hypothetical protein